MLLRKRVNGSYVGLDLWSKDPRCSKQRRGHSGPAAKEEGIVSYKQSKKASALTAAGTMIFLVALSGQSFAQGFGGLGQLLGGGSNAQGSSGNGQGFGGLSQLLGGGSRRSRNSNGASAGVTVQRSAAPYIGIFDGKQKHTPGGNLSAQFACYPAHDSALPQSDTFVCYTAERQTPGALSRISRLRAGNSGAKHRGENLCVPGK